MKYIINGKFLTRRITGVQRYAYEICLQLDKLCKKNEIGILIPKRCDNTPKYNNIKIIRYGSLPGNTWEQICLPFYLIKNKCIGINLCNVAPLIKPDIVCSHDMNFKVNSHYFTFLNVLWANIQHINFKFRARKIITVSNFSKKEIKRIYGINDERLIVIPNAWQHFERIIPDYKFVDEKRNIYPYQYYFTLASLAPHKNFKWIIENARKYPENIYVIAGNVNQKLYNQKFDLAGIKNIIYVGYVSDEEAKGLMMKSKAFVFPSLYEGFGIPILEAMCCGTNVIASDIEVFKEICDEEVIYINPFDYTINIEQLLQNGHKKSYNKILGKYSWEKSAHILLEFLRDYV